MKNSAFYLKNYSNLGIKAEASPELRLSYTNNHKEQEHCFGNLLKLLTNEA